MLIFIQIESFRSINLSFSNTAPNQKYLIQGRKHPGTCKGQLRFLVPLFSASFAASHRVPISIFLELLAAASSFGSTLPKIPKFKGEIRLD